MPNVLIWVNHEIRNHINTLEIIYPGASTMSNREVVGGYDKYSEGDLKGKKSVIDLHIWLDADRETGTSLMSAPSWFFSNNLKRPEYADKLRRVFGVDARQISLINQSGAK